MYTVKAPTSQSPRCTYYDRNANAQSHLIRHYVTHTKIRDVEECSGKIIFPTGKLRVHV